MMKQVYGFAALLLVAGSAAHAQFNTDALKKMQEEGHRIVAAATEAQSFRVGNNLCLSSGPALRVQTCDATVLHQRWSDDEAGHLIAHDGTCLAGNRLLECSTANAQLWEQDKKGRLVNKANQCLQVQGQPLKAGAGVVATRCSESPAQVWEAFDPKPKP